VGLGLEQGVERVELELLVLRASFVLASLVLRAWLNLRSFAVPDLELQRPGVVGPGALRVRGQEIPQPLEGVLLPLLLPVGVRFPVERGVGLVSRSRGDLPEDARGLVPILVLEGALPVAVHRAALLRGALRGRVARLAIRRRRQQRGEDENGGQHRADQSHDCSFRLLRVTRTLNRRSACSIRAFARPRSKDAGASVSCSSTGSSSPRTAAIRRCPARSAARRYIRFALRSAAAHARSSSSDGAPFLTSSSRRWDDSRCSMSAACSTRSRAAGESAFRSRATTLS